MASRELHRFLHFGWNAARYALGPVAALLIPWAVIHQGSKALWGEVVGVMITVQLAAHVLKWGSREMLPRLFAAAPMAIPSIWTGNTLARLLLLLPMTIALLFALPDTVTAIPWLVLLCMNNSFEALIVWHKRFFAAFCIDAAGLLVTLGGILLSPSLALNTVIMHVIHGQIVRGVLQLIIFRRDISAAPRAAFRTHIAEAFPFLLIALSGLLGSRVDLYITGLTASRETLAEYQVVQGYFVQLQALAGIIAVPFTRELYRLGKPGVAKATGRLASLGLVALLPVGIIGQLLFTRLYGFDTDWSTCMAGCLLGWPVFAYTPMVQTLYRHGKETAMVLAGFITAAISAGLTWLFLPRFGVTGGLAAAAISQLLMLIAVRTIFDRLPAMPDRFADR